MKTVNQITKLKKWAVPRDVPILHQRASIPSSLKVAWRLTVITQVVGPSRHISNKTSIFKNNRHCQQLKETNSISICHNLDILNALLLQLATPSKKKKKGSKEETSEVKSWSIKAVKKSFVFPQKLYYGPTKYSVSHFKMQVSVTYHKNRLPQF